MTGRFGLTTMPDKPKEEKKKAFTSSKYERKHDRTIQETLKFP